MDKDARIYVAGHRGLVGSAIVRALSARGFTHILSATSVELDLRDPAAVEKFFETQRPEYVFVAAARVGGILANDRNPATFIYDNLMIETSVIHSAWRANVRKLLFLASTCIYPKLAPQPLKEEYLLSGSLEPTNQWYAIAKIAGIKLCEAYRKQYGCRFISTLSTNLYGPGDNFDLTGSHVLPALIRKFHEAKLTHAREVSIWGSGKPLREFVHVDDCAIACLLLMDVYDEPGIINIGHGKDISIRELAYLVRDVVGFRGAITFDESKPDGTPRKLVDASRIFDLGWKPVIALEDGIRTTYEWYQRQQVAADQV
jgi:GDP-L-fucose synthase